MRPALAAGCMCFVLIGAPVGIWFSRSDYLSTFVSCFLPTIVIYYPLMLCGTNMAKDGRLPAVVGLWMANAAIGLAALVLYSRLAAPLNLPTRGSCCVRQCNVPRPHTRSTAWMPTTSRPGNTSAKVPSAIRSIGSLNVGTSTRSLAT